MAEIPPARYERLASTQAPEWLSHKLRSSKNSRRDCTHTAKGRAPDRPARTIKLTNLEAALSTLSYVIAIEVHEKPAA